jgi:SAM-dependent methyltransferase
MKISAMLRAALLVARQSGFHTLISFARERWKAPFRQSTASRWKGGLASEIYFWDVYLGGAGRGWDKSFESRQDPNAPLQPYIAELLPPVGDVSVLDVGAGPLTFLGKKIEGRKLHLTAVDPLADEYDALLRRHNIVPPVKTQRGAAERLTELFKADSFDLVYARNCLDHSCDPEQAILEMVAVARPNCCVFLEHRLNEADRRQHHGLHIWNLSANEKGELMLRSDDQSINVSEKHAELFSAQCVVREGGQWLLTKIRKR